MKKKEASQLDRETLDRQIQEFLARGGEIKQVNKGTSGSDDTAYGRKPVKA